MKIAYVRFFFSLLLPFQDSLDQKLVRTLFNENPSLVSIINLKKEPHHFFFSYNTVNRERDGEICKRERTFKRAFTALRITSLENPNGSNASTAASILFNPTYIVWEDNKKKKKRMRKMEKQ